MVHPYSSDLWILIPLPYAVLQPTLHGCDPARRRLRREILRHVPADPIMRTLKVLFFAADPLSADGGHSRLLLDKEAREIKHEMLSAPNWDRVEFVPCGATRITDLRRELLGNKPQVVHFSGHGGSAGLVLEGEDGRPHRVGAEALKGFFSAFRQQIRLVVLNACHSRPQAEAIAEAVGCAIGTPSRIGDDDAINFSAAFYSSIAHGESVQSAFDQACATLGMKDCPGEEIPQLIVRDDVDASQLVLIPNAEPAPHPAPIPPTITSPPADPVVTSAPVDSTPKFVLAPPVSVPAPPMRRRVVWGAGAAALCGASLALWAVVPPDPCAPVREVQRAVQAAGPAPMGLLSAPGASADPGGPMAGPPELAEAKRLHQEGNHAADLPLFEKAAQAGSVEARIAVGWAYIRGEGTAVQRDSGLDLLQEAAKTDHPEAMNALGEAYLWRGPGERNSDYLAKHWFQKAADKGHAAAMRNLGNLYRDGRSVAASGTTALEWYAKAAEAGFFDAMVDAGAMYEQGGVVPRNAKQAFCWYQAAGELGSPRGMMEHARMLESRGDHAEARELREKARQAGHAEASPPAGERPAQ